jgi:hypothetical protein
MSIVLFTPEAAGQLAELAVLASDGLETGGILLGADHGLTGPIIVTSCGGPGPEAIRRRSYFPFTGTVLRQLPISRLPTS